MKLHLHQLKLIQSFLFSSFIIKQSQVTLSFSVEPQQCWQCQSEISSDTEFCLSCKSLQPLNKQRDHFSVLGIQKNFSIDSKALTKRFRILQTQFHPDRYTLKLEVTVCNYLSLLLKYQQSKNHKCISIVLACS